MEDFDMEDFAELVAKKVFEKKVEKEEREKEAEKRSELWEEGDEFLICKPCSAHRNSPDLPKELLKSKRGKGGAAHGIIGKISEGGERRLAKDLRKTMSRHCEGSLHKWCVREGAKVKMATKSYEEENKEVGLTVIKTYLKTARRGGSAADFINDIDFTHLLPGVTKSTKNNSRNTFFELRDDAFEVVTGAVQELFRSEEVTEFSATLDKVTVQHRSFTALLTFFFYEGSIFCLLNALLKMEEEDYDAEGTARMVVNCQKETLGLTRTQLANKLLHFRSADLS
jgi:hypothetical protein